MTKKIMVLPVDGEEVVVAKERTVVVVEEKALPGCVRSIH